VQVVEGSQISASTFGRGNSGSVRILAGDRILFSGIRPDGVSSSAAFSNVNSGAVGNGGNLRLAAPIIEIREGAQLSASTFGRGNAGRIRVVASDRLTLSGISPTEQFTSAILSRVEAGAVGNSGGIALLATVVEVRDGAQVSAATLGRGNAGNVRVQSETRITFAGTSADGRFRSAAFSTVGSQATGRGGDLRFITPVLEFLDGTGFSASTFGNGDAGDVRIRVGDRFTLAGTSADGQFSSVGFSRVEENAIGSGGDLIISAQRLDLRDGAGLTTSTRGIGGAGDIRIRVSDRLTITGNLPEDPEVQSGLFSQVETTAIGDGGNLNLQAQTLTLDFGVLSARSEGQGTGGNIAIAATDLRLTDQATISTETFSTNGGNILLSIEDLLVLRDNSLISTEAGTIQSGGDGGDITLNNADGFIVAVPEENSDIVANAFEGRGGNIRITTQGIFGLEFRDARTPLSDITASSEIGVDGEVEIITPNVDPTQGLVALPTDVVDATDQIGQVCPRGPGASAQLGRFVVTGRGGISTSPLDVLDAPEIVVDWLDTRNRPATDPETLPPSQGQPEQPALVEARGWVRTGDGRVQLVATTPRVNGAIASDLSPCPEGISAS
jgi:large exoprotein involved in heme utilization and adhesion